MKKIKLIALIAALALTVTACTSPVQTSSDAEATTPAEETVQTTAEAVPEIAFNTDCTPPLLDKEKSSVTVGELSPECEYYAEVVNFASQITELSIYDSEIDDTFIVHISLPPDYSADKKYPLVLMTDGVWRLSDHPEVNRYMTNGEISGVILASIGYPNGYDYRTIRERDLVTQCDLFLNFICDNLIPLLSVNYSIDFDNSMFTGHSYGGFFAYYALFNNDTICKNYFKNWYIGSTSMQASFNRQTVRDFEKAYYERSKVLNANIYETCGSLEQFGFKNFNTTFIEELKERGYEGLTIEYEEIPDTNHDNVYKPSLHNALLKFYGLE